MTIRKEKLETYKKQLLERRETLASELRQKTANMIDDDAVYSDSVDQASAETDKALAVQMKNRDQGILIQIDAALRRIDAGSFGECQECGESISEARLQAFPFTTLCIDCKAALESEEHRFPGKV